MDRQTSNQWGNGMDKGAKNWEWAAGCVLNDDGGMGPRSGIVVGRIIY